MKPVEPSSFQAFKEAANESLGLPTDDDFELVPLNSVLSQIESLYSREISQFETIIATIERDERYFKELESALDEFRHRLVDAFALPHSTAMKLECVPVDKVIFVPQSTSQARFNFCAAHRDQYKFNHQRGNYLFDFMLAHFMEQSSNYKRVNRGLRSRLVPYAGSLESIYSIWKANELGRVWTLPMDTLAKTAYAAANNRLIDGLYSAVGFDGAYQIFQKHLNPLNKFPLQFLYTVVMSDPKTILQQFAHANRLALPRYNATRVGGTDHAPEFRCVMAFGKRTFEGSADSKLHAEAIAARNAVEFLAANDRNGLLLLIAHTISSGMQSEEIKSSAPRISLPKLSALRQVTRTTCSYASLLKCVTLKADVLPYSLSHSATNESFAFCGSWLAMALAAGKSHDETGSTLSLPNAILDCVRKTRHNIFPRSKDVSNAQCLDVVQAIIYGEFLQAGYVGASGVFERCILVFHKGNQVDASKPFAAGGALYTALAGVCAAIWG